MEDFKRTERLTALTQILVDNPYTLFPLRGFTERFQVAKSTLSEDVSIIKSVFKRLNLGRVETVTGVAGGIRYIPYIKEDEEKEMLTQIASELSRGERILPGGFIYMTDLIFSADIAWRVGKIFASKFIDKRPDYIITIETKGIPIAMMTARAFNVPLVTIRRNTRVTEGSVVTINYVSGSSGKIQTMSLSRRALPEGSKVVFIDDFMKAGGTAKGVLELMKEFKVEVAGVGVLVETAHPGDKLIDDYLSLLLLEKVDERNKKVVIRPSHQA
ncbi:pur operon repressor [Halothermothrix orenii]|uniref:Purine operon repressor, PurR n=1 Tax=Halothermothrix orenii (strain H 168 / OCM 544 / DSM 9562) TaxID=373903 RepID=B8D0E3_HALOH|nr:pur operon repressor [Halothermothrix orenii]ACL70879.1 purine operon repressor, PurR [Halothermothrix orenii H 168]